MSWTIPLSVFQVPLGILGAVLATCRGPAE
jgi:hypothetical protein